MYKLTLTDHAKRMLGEQALYIEACFGPNVSERVLTRIYKQLQQLAMWPEMGHPVPNTYLSFKGYRILVVERAVCLYLIDSLTKEIRVTYIFNSRQNYIAHMLKEIK